MNITSFIKSWMKSKKSVPITKYGVLKTRVDSIVSISVHDFIIGENHLQIQQPVNNLTIKSIGTSSILGVDIVHHYLEDATGNDNFWLQESSTGNQIHSLMLFSQIDEIHPQSTGDWDFVLEQLNQSRDVASWSVNNITYESVWNHPQTYTETYEDTKATSDTTSRLYSRTYLTEENDQGTEYLYVAIEDESCVRVYCGIDVVPAAINVF